jgi:hypothetical protein
MMATKWMAMALENLVSVQLSVAVLLEVLVLVLVLVLAALVKFSLFHKVRREYA